jgi:hypothetical protein
MKWGGREDRSTPSPTAFHLAYQVRRLLRASSPTDTAELAEYRIEKTIVRKIA